MTSSLGIIAGRGTYPLELAESARAQGVQRICALAFHGETSRHIRNVADEVRWVHVGALAAFLEAFRAFHIDRAVMAGQIRPSNLFLTRLDKPMRDLLARLPRRNADTIFAAIGAELAVLGIELLPASQFMESRIPQQTGVLTRTQPEAQDLADIQQGFVLAKTCAKLQAGQSVAIKRGTVIAVEGFEGTDRMIRRAGICGGPGCVIVKVAQENHDMRWDIPVVGLRTLHSLRKARCRCLALEVGKAILLERERFLSGADQAGISIVVTA
jgi:DUF1009 family protein